MPRTAAAFQILLALANTPRHGLGILDEVESHTGHALAIGTLYRSLKHLVEHGLIEEAPETDTSSTDPRRRYYRLTTQGRAAMRAEAARAVQLADWVHALRAIGRGGR
jgi:PadR family transcriptional regulator PadR